MSAKKLFIVSLIIGIVLVASIFIPFLNPLLNAFKEYFSLIWWAIVVGLLLGGIIDRFIPREYISKYLTQNKKRTIFYSVFLGFVMAACSHGILAISIELYKKGASIASVIAFLLASPWANLPITILLFGFFGFKAFFLVVSAIVIAIITGFIYQFLDKKGLIEKSKYSVKVEKEFSIKQDIKKRIKNYKFTAENLIKDLKEILKGSWSLSKMVLWWILIGIIFASVARAYIPPTIFIRYMGPTFFGLIVTLILATVIEVCSEGSSPLAFEIFRQTKAFGNSFAFLMAGVATDMSEIGLIWTNIGRRAAIWLPVITVPQILILGYLFNLFL